jgi:transposase
LAKSILWLLVEQFKDTEARIKQLEARLAEWHRNSKVSKLLASVPGVGVMTASAILRHAGAKASESCRGLVSVVAGSGFLQKGAHAFRERVQRERLA